MEVGDRVRYIHDNSNDDNYYMSLRGNTGTITGVAEKQGSEYVEVWFDNPIYKDYESRNSRGYFCLASYLEPI